MTHVLIYPNTYGSEWSNEIRQNRETDEDHNKYCVEEGFQLGRVKLDRDGDWGSEAPGVGRCSINIRAEISLVQEKQFIFWKQFCSISLSGISNTSIFKVCNILHWVNFLLMKTLSNIFRSYYFWGRWYFNLLLQCKISAIWLVETACIFLIFLITTVQISMECETQKS